MWHKDPECDKSPNSCTKNSENLGQICLERLHEGQKATGFYGQVASMYRSKHYKNNTDGEYCPCFYTGCLLRGAILECN